MLLHFFLIGYRAGEIKKIAINLSEGILCHAAMADW